MQLFTVVVYKQSCLSSDSVRVYGPFADKGEALSWIGCCVIGSDRWVIAPLFVNKTAMVGLVNKMLEGIE